MTVFDVLGILDDVFTPGTTAFSDYVKATSDDNGFLRTAFCKKRRILDDRSIPPDTTHVVIGSDCVIEERNLRCQWTGDPFEHEWTMTKLQICFSNAEGIGGKIDWNRQMGYHFCCVADLSAREVFEMS